MIQTIIKTAFLAGTLDIITTCLRAYLMTGMMPAKLLRFIASGVFGKAAFVGGNNMLVMGLFFHFIIAFSCTVVFFFLYPKINFLKYGWLTNSGLIAIVAWVVTNWMIIPMSQIPTRPFNFASVTIAILILFVCIGMPIAYNTQNFYTHEKNK